MNDCVVVRPVSAAFQRSQLQRSQLQRSHGCATIDARHTERGTVLADLYQHANAKIRIPNTYEQSLQAVLVNTAGGIAGGDTLNWSVRAQADADIVVTTQACERVYGHATQTALVNNRINVFSGASCAWLPQETIIYNGALLHRTLTVDMAADASFLGIESIVLGRAHMGETLNVFELRDSWIIQRAGVPLYADVLRLDGIGDAMTSIAGLNGMTVLATMVFVAKPDGEPIAAMRDRIAELTPLGGIHIGVSGFDQHLVCRMLAPTSYALRQLLPNVLGAIDCGVHLPRIWRF